MIRLAVALQLADLISFLLVTAHYGTFASAVVSGAEAGPLRYVWAAGGPLLVVAAKCAAVAFVLAVLAHRYERRPGYSHLYVLALLVMALMGALGVAANVGAMA